MMFMVAKDHPTRSEIIKFFYSFLFFIIMPNMIQLIGFGNTLLGNINRKFKGAQKRLGHPSPHLLPSLALWSRGFGIGGMQICGFSGTNRSELLAGSSIESN
jgi:hypothetical protein